MNCLAADIHVIDLMGNRIHSNHSLLNCGQTLIYSTACTIAYHCCYTNKCNKYESPMPSSSSSPPPLAMLFLLKRIIISSNLFLLYHRFLT